MATPCRQRALLCLRACFWPILTAKLMISVHVHNRLRFGVRVASKAVVLRKPSETHWTPLGNPFHRQRKPLANAHAKPCRSRLNIGRFGVLPLRIGTRLRLGVFALCTLPMRPKSSVLAQENIVSNFLSSTALFSERRNVWKQKWLPHRDAFLVGFLYGCCGAMWSCCCMHVPRPCDVCVIGVTIRSRGGSPLHLHRTQLSVRHSRPRYAARANHAASSGPPPNGGGARMAPPRGRGGCAAGRLQ